MNFASNPVLGETPKFMDLGLSIANTTDKLKSVIGHANRSGVLTDNSDWLTSSCYIAEVMEGIVSEVKAYSNFIKNSEFETRTFF